MVRTKTNVARHRRVKRVMKRARGNVGGRHRLYRTAIEAVERADAYAYRHRRRKKRDFRRLWITRISAGCRTHGMSYSHFVHGLKMANIEIDRKQLSELAIHDAAAFEQVLESARKALAG